MINRVVLVGRMTKDPELRRTGNGKAVTSFTLAIDRGYNTQDGQTADFVNCVVWNKPAENTSQYCSKGSLVGIEGRLRSRSYDNNQGQKVFVTEVVCNSVQFLETKAMQAKKNNTTEVPKQSQTEEFYDMKTVDINKELDESVNSFDITEEDIQF